MTADLLILGAGVAGLSAALGACDRGAFPLVFDAGDPPIPGRRFDVLFDDDFTPVGGPMPASLTWACTRILGVAAEPRYLRLPGYVVDRDALRQHLLTEALRRGATVAWQTPCAWDGQRATSTVRELPDVPVLLASAAFLPEANRTERRILRCWQGTGTPASSYLLTPVACPDGQVLLTMTGANRWSAFGWQRPEAEWPSLPDGATLVVEQDHPVGGGAPMPLCGPNWLRLGSAAGLEPAHGFGLASRLALSRTTGWLAAGWTITGDAAWEGYAEWLAPYRYWLATAVPPWQG